MYAGAEKLADDDSDTARMLVGVTFSKMPMQYGDIPQVPIEMQCVALHPIPVLPALLVQSAPNSASGVSVARIGSRSDNWRPVCTTSCNGVGFSPPEQNSSASDVEHPLQLLDIQTRQSPVLALLALPQRCCCVAASGHGADELTCTSARTISASTEISLVAAAAVIEVECEFSSCLKAFGCARVPQDRRRGHARGRRRRRRGPGRRRPFVEFATDPRPTTGARRRGRRRRRAGDAGRAPRRRGAQENGGRAVQRRGSEG